MKTYIFSRIGINLKEIVHAHNMDEAYILLYKKGIPFYAVKLEKTI